METPKTSDTPKTSGTFDNLSPLSGSSMLFRGSSMFPSPDLASPPRDGANTDDPMLQCRIPWWCSPEASNAAAAAAAEFEAAKEADDTRTLGDALRKMWEQQAQKK